MRFKIFFNEEKKALDINCLQDSHSDTILPTNTDQHVYFPIPNELSKEIKEEMMKILDGKRSEEYNAITDEISKLSQRRKEMVTSLREELNPKIIEVCERFKEANAEYFI